MCYPFESSYISICTCTCTCSYPYHTKTDLKIWSVKIHAYVGGLSVWIITWIDSDRWRICLLAGLWKGPTNVMHISNTIHYTYTTQLHTNGNTVSLLVVIKMDDEHAWMETLHLFKPIIIWCGYAQVHIYTYTYKCKPGSITEDFEWMSHLLTYHTHREQPIIPHTK